MSYSQENIANIVRTGQLENYLAADRKAMEQLVNGQIVEQGRIIYFGYMWGEYAGGYAMSPYGGSGKWSREWNVDGFASDAAAIGYARAALISHLTQTAAAQIEAFRAGIALLEAARG